MVTIRCPEKFLQAASIAPSTKGENFVIADVAHVHFAFALAARGNSKIKEC
jgi:hypothetical protein